MNTRAVKNSSKTLLTTVMLWLFGGPAFAQISAAEPELPAIHGAMVFGARPDHPFLYRIPATGARPISFSAIGLPPGLKVDGSTGIITGTVKSAGSTVVVLLASNAAGRSERKFRIVIGNQLALTPPMGWSTWDFLQTEASDRSVRAQADAMVRTGLIDHGYSFLNIDDGWSTKRADVAAGVAPRDAQGNILPNLRFSDMKGLTAYLHSNGMKAGLYTSPSPQTCGKYEGSFGHEQQDADQFASWGFDLLKYDWCGYPAKDKSVSEMQKPYRLMGSILAAEPRDMLFSLCQYGRGDVWTWGREVGGQLWRITGDLAWGKKGIYSSWDNIVADFDQGDRGKAVGGKAVGPGGWNDLDDLLVGRIAYIPYNQHPPNVSIDRRMPPPLNPDEQYLQMSLWSLLSAPLLIGGDLTTIDSFSLSILSNDEVIAIDQDPLGRAATQVSQQDKVSTWVKELEDGSMAVGLFNLNDSEVTVTAKWNDLGLTGKHKLRDLWRQKELGEFDGEFQALVAPHGVVLVKIAPTKI